jgi:hypothetical protein
MRLNNRSPIVGMLAAGLAVLALAAPAAATTYRVAGKQLTVDENAGKFKVNGSLVGDWTITRFDTLAKSPLLRAKGTERFKGCLDVRRDGCGGSDPTGTLSFSFTYEALFASADPASLVWGSCRHPIVSGTGGFAGAKGVIAMVDTPIGGGVSTSYIGNVTLGSGAASSRHAQARAAAVARHCG